MNFYLQFLSDHIITLYLSDFQIWCYWKTTNGPDSDLEIHPLHHHSFVADPYSNSSCPLNLLGPPSNCFWRHFISKILQEFILSCSSDMSIPHFISILSTICFQIVYFPPSEAWSEFNKHTAQWEKWLYSNYYITFLFNCTILKREQLCFACTVVSCIFWSYIIFIFSVLL